MRATRFLAVLITLLFAAPPVFAGSSELRAQYAAGFLRVQRNDFAVCTAGNYSGGPVGMKLVLKRHLPFEPNATLVESGGNAEVVDMKGCRGVPNHGVCQLVHQVSYPDSAEELSCWVLAKQPVRLGGNLRIDETLGANQQGSTNVTIPLRPLHRRVWDGEPCDDRAVRCEVQTVPE